MNTSNVLACITIKDRLNKLKKAIIDIENNEINEHVSIRKDMNTIINILFIIINIIY